MLKRRLTIPVIVLFGFLSFFSLKFDLGVFSDWMEPYWKRVEDRNYVDPEGASGGSYFHRVKNVGAEWVGKHPQSQVPYKAFSFLSVALLVLGLVLGTLIGSLVL